MKKRLSLILTALAAAVLFLACPNPEQTILSDDVRLASLDITGASLDGTFSASATHFSVFVDDTVTTAHVEAEAADEAATISFNVANPAAIALDPGKNTVSIVVTAESGAKKTYTLDIWRCNASGNAVDSAGGSYLGQTVSYSVYRNGTLEYQVKRGVAENQPLYFEQGVAYKVVATSSGRAASALDNFRYQAGDPELTLVCQKLEQSTFPAEAPVITSFAWTSDAPSSYNLAGLQAAGMDWTELEEGADVDISALTFIRVIVTAKAEMDPTSWAGQGIMLGFGETPGFFAGLYPDATDSSFNTGTGVFTAEAYFDVEGASIADGDITASVVVYDRSSNRSQKNVTVNAVSGVASSGVDLSSGGYSFSRLNVVSNVYGVSRQYYAAQRGTDSLSALSTGPCSYRSNVSFYLLDSFDDPVDVLGFIIERSENDGASFRKIGTVNYGFPTAGYDSDGYHYYYDLDPALELGKEYIYRVTAFTDGDSAHRLSETTLPVHLLPPYTMRLTAPADGGRVAGGTVPTLKVRLSDPSLWDPDETNSFNFSVSIREKSGDVLYYGNFSFAYYGDGTTKLWHEDPYAGWQSFDSTTETMSDYLTFDTVTGELIIKPKLLEGPFNLYSSSGAVLQSGKTYEWDIFGPATWADNDPGNGGSVYSPYFFRRHADSTTEKASYSYSYADSYEDGKDSLNGWFELVAE